MDPNKVPIAIIGMACRFSGDIDSPSKLWHACAEGKSAWSRIPASRFNLHGIYHPNGAKVNTTNVIGGHFLNEDIALFDAGFFNFPSELASSFDPQFRLQLECTYEAMESAGLTLQGVAGSNTSVFAGAFFKDYNDAHFRDPETLPRSLLMGVGSAMASNRLSHFFDLRGASMSIDTGCSTTLTAFHQACQNLRSGESTMSIVGGANVLLNPDNFIVMSSLTLLSPAGKSYAFDSRASGYGRGEGSATVIIKRLDDALRDGDPIRGIIRGSAVNQDGKTETITTPSQEAQEELIRLCYHRAGLDLAETTYFEAHGTGTPTGDPIEARAIASVFKDTRLSDEPLRIGSVKTNIGHCETASGLASIIKVAMALERGQIPPSINFEQQNPSIHLEKWNLKLARELEPWPEVNGIRRASVNNFGYGGANAHVIMESYQSYIADKKRQQEEASATNGINGYHTPVELSNGVNGHHNNGVNGSSFNGSYIENGDFQVLAANGSLNGVNGDHAHNRTSNGTTANGTNGVHPNGTSNILTNGINGVHLNGTTSNGISADSGNGVHLNGTTSNGSANGTNGCHIHNGASNGVTSNGITRYSNGTNGYHNTQQVKLKSRVITLSAKDEQAGLTMASNLKDYLQTVRIENEQTFFDSLAYTLGQRRSTLTWASAHPAEDVSGLIKALEFGKMKPTRRNEAPKIGFVFTGQGSQWHAMGRELIEAYPVFKDCLLEAEGYLKEFGCKWSLTEELCRDAETSRVNELALSTPLTVVVQIGIVRLLRSWGITPTAVTSHSSGEIASAYTAGALTLRAATAISFARGQLAGSADPTVVVRKGGMVAVGLGAEDAQKYISRVTSGQVMVACLNSPSSITASGDVPAVEELERLLKEDNIFARRLKIDAAYHSHHMQFLAAPYLAWLQKLVTEKGHLDEGIIYSSPTTGKRETSGKKISSPDHWVTSLTRPVQFVEAFRSMCFEDSSSATSSVDVVIEIGPHAALSGPVQEIISLPDFKGTKISYFPSLLRKSSAVDTIQALACDLIRSGYPLNMDAINFPFGRDGVSVLHDLPRYPWNHSIRHWSEPRINKSHRNRAEAPHDLLGSVVLGTNMITPSWRHLVRIADLPWLRDHVVQSQILYPGAGYICMAIEAAYQTAKGIDKRVLGYQMRDIDFLQALVVPDTTEGVEVQITFSPCSEKAIYARGWTAFQVYSVTTDNQWIEHCKGLIKADFVAGDDKAQWTPPLTAVTQIAGQREAADYRKHVDPRDVYQSMRSVGICHGPIFQNMKTTKARSNKSVTAFSIADTAATLPSFYQHEHVIDPTTLDSLFQAAYAGYIAMPGIGAKMSTPLVPRSIKRLYVAQNISNEVGHKFKAYCDMNKATKQAFDADVAVMDDEESSKQVPVLKIDSFVTQSLGGVLPQQVNTYDNEKLATVRWAPDLSFVTSEYLKKQLCSTIEPSEADIIMDLKRLCAHYINKALATFTAANLSQLESHHQKFYDWMKLQAELASENKLAPNSCEWINGSEEEQASLAEKASAASVNGEMVCRLGPHIPAILRREVTPLELMLEGKLLHRYYVEALKWDRSSQQVGDIVKHFAHKNPRSKILEIGGGTGGTTTYVLKALGDDKSGVGPLAASYDFTDISSGFFEAAQENFQDWESLVRYKKLDIEDDPAKQGFETGTYDLIIACQVLHATKNMDRTMANVRRLLKPGGNLVIMETTQDQQDLLLAFGLLPGWWLSEEEERQLSPSLSIDMWDRVLKRMGFGGVEIEVHDCESEDFYSFSVIKSTASTSNPSNYDSEIVLITGTTSPSPSWLEELKESISKAAGITPKIESLETVDAEGKVCIFLGDLQQKSILRDPNFTEFEAIKSLCTKSKGLLWATCGGAVDCQNPDASLSQGFLRTLRVEYAGKRMIALDLDPKNEFWSGRTVSALTEVVEKLFDYSKDSVIMDFELADRDGVIQVPRYYRDTERNKVVFADPASQAMAQLEPFCQDDRPLRLTVGTPGLLDTLAFNDDPDASKELCHDSVEIEPQAFGVNFRDVMVAMGQLDADYMGFECSGIVKRVGSTAAAEGLKVGDRVAALMRGHYGNLVRVDWTSAVHIPDDMTFEIAATLPMCYTTAYFSLHHLGRVQKGDKVLIHAGTGGVGQAAIVLAKHAGAEIFVTVGTDKKREFVMNEHGIQPDHIFSSRDSSFAPGVLAMTQGKGVEIVLNTLAGPLLQESFNCIARFGRFIEIGKRDLELNSSLEMGTFTRSVSLSSFDLLLFGEHQGVEVNRVLKEIIHLFRQKIITPVQPVTIFPLSDIEKTFRLMQAGKHMGKIVVSVKPDDLVRVLPQIPSAKFRPDASYLVVGGLGGIGRSVCQWMAERGAKHLIILSRSANAQEKTRPFTAEMERIGCTVKAIGCDISNETALADVLAACAQELPPIRGVIQGAMVLEDSIVEQMTLDQYNAAIRPKVHGSWNLHTLLSSDDLDFFVMLSSLSGVVGFASQCNYAAGGTFQDALARHRAAKGLHGASIDIGIVQSVGYVAENQGTADRLRSSGYKVLTEEDVLGAIESAIASSPQNQMLLGLNGANWEESGMSRDQRFTPLRFRETGSSAPSAVKVGSGELSGRLAAVSSFEEATEIVLKGITNKLVDIFMIAEAEVDTAKSLAAYGVDSLVAVEMRNMLALRIGAEVSIFDIMQSPSIAALASTVALKSSHIDPCILPS